MSQAEAILSQLGMTINEAIEIFLRQIILVGGIPFPIKQLDYNTETEAAIQEARDIISGKVNAKSYSSVAEMNADIDLEHYE